MWRIGKQKEGEIEGGKGEVGHKGERKKGKGRRGKGNGQGSTRGKEVDKGG